MEFAFPAPDHPDAVLVTDFQGDRIGNGLEAFKRPAVVQLGHTFLVTEGIGDQFPDQLCFVRLPSVGGVPDFHRVVLRLLRMVRVGNRKTRIREPFGGRGQRDLQTGTAGGNDE